MGSSAGTLAGGVEGDVALSALDSRSCKDEGKSEKKELGEHLEKRVFELVVQRESVMCVCVLRECNVLEGFGCFARRSGSC